MYKWFTSNSFHKERNTDDIKKFFTKEGWLTKYALSCGYCERVTFGQRGVIRLVLAEKDGVYFVIATGCVPKAFRHWTDARRYFVAEVRNLHKRYGICEYD
jgi:hypothetical protein